MEVFGSPSNHQFPENPRLFGSARQVPFGVPGGNSQTVINGTIKGGGVAQKLGVLPVQMAHFLNHVDARRRIQHFIEDPGSLQPQVHQNEIDIIISAAARLERIAHPLLFF